jgi:S-DNA-T family DNA segregation ATPase FtsK/SpoIIIE
VFGGVVLIVTGYRHLTREGLERHHVWLAVPGFLLVLLMSSALEALRLYRLPIALPGAPGGALGDMIGHGLETALGFNGATLLLIALFAVGWSLFTGMSWLRLMERLAPLSNRRSRARQRREAQRERLTRRGAEERELSWRLCGQDDEREPVLVVAPPVEVQRSERVVREKQKPLFQDLPDSPLPPLVLLEDAPSAQEQLSADALEYTSRLIERKLADFGVAVKVLAAYPGPVITRFEIEPAVGVKGAQIVNLVKDLARALSVVSIRLVETIPGKSCMGLELPNPRRQIVRLI